MFGLERTKLAGLVSPVRRVWLVRNRPKRVFEWYVDGGTIRPKATRGATPRHKSLQSVDRGNQLKLFASTRVRVFASTRVRAICKYHLGDGETSFTDVDPRSYGSGRPPPRRYY